MLTQGFGPRLIAVLLAAACLSGCPKPQMIRVAERGTSSAPPVIEMQNFLYAGVSITHPVVSTETQTSPVSIIVMPLVQPNVGRHAKIQITALARDTTYGPAYFRIRIERGGKVVKEVVASQSVDANGMTSPTLGIVGTSVVYPGVSTGPGFKYPIDLWMTSNEPVTVTMYAVSFGWLAQTLVMNYSCPICPPPAPATSGGGGWPMGGTNPGNPPAPSSSSREAGAFVAVDPDARRSGEVITSPDGKVTATIQPYLGPQHWVAVFKSGTQSLPISFDISPPSLLPSTFGGAAFTAKSERAVVASYYDNSLGVLDDGSFQVVSLKNPFVEVPSMFRVNFTDPVSGSQNAGVIEPQIMFSPDASLAIVLAAPVAGAPADARSLQVWDLADTSGQSLFSGNIKEFNSAVVVGSQIVVKFADLTTMAIAIP